MSIYDKTRVFPKAVPTPMEGLSPRNRFDGTIHFVDKRELLGFSNPAQNALADEVGSDDRTSTLSGVTAFTYMYRRFGPPNIGGDDLKDLGCWLLAPEEGSPGFGLAFLVRCCASRGDLGFSVNMGCFGPKKGLQDRFTARTRMGAWEARHRESERELGPTLAGFVDAWCDETGIFDSHFDSLIREAVAEYGYCGLGQVINDEICLMRGEDGLDSMTLDEAVAAKERIWAENPLPVYVDGMLPGEEADTLRGWFKAFLDDMARVVYVRDIPIGVTGRVEDRDVTGVSAGYAACSGYPAPSSWVRDPAAHDRLAEKRKVQAMRYRLLMARGKLAKALSMAASGKAEEGIRAAMERLDQRLAE